MKLERKDKAFVAWWIDHQFTTKSHFPDAGCKPGTNLKRPTKKHLKAYKAWRRLPLKASKIQAWMDEWLNEHDKQALMHSIKRQHKDHPPWS